MAVFFFGQCACTLFFPQLATTTIISRGSQKRYSVASKEPITMMMRNTFISHQEESNFDNQHFTQLHWDRYLEALKQSTTLLMICDCDPRDEFYSSRQLAELYTCTLSKLVTFYYFLYEFCVPPSMTRACWCIERMEWKS